MKLIPLGGNMSDWFVQDGNLTDGLKRKFVKYRQFHLWPKKINDKWYWLKTTYHIEMTTDFHILIYVGNTEYPKKETFQVRKKDYLKDAHLVYEAYESLGKLIKI